MQLDTSEMPRVIAGLGLVAMLALSPIRADQPSILPAIPTNVSAQVVADHNPHRVHLQLSDTVAPQLRFSSDVNFPSWQRQLRDQLIDVLGLSRMEPAPLRATREARRPIQGHAIDRIEFDSESGSRVPGFLLLPDAQRFSAPFPTMICLQGHAKPDGMRRSLGITPDRGGRDIALQAVRQGWAALCIEQRCFGERRGSCSRESMNALMLGRTLTGERVFDVQRAIDWIESQKDLDTSRIGCMGNSTGGTVTFYAACVDPRIRVSIVSCSYCSYHESWIKIPHCQCGYLPGILRYADMGDLGGLIAPRDLVIVAGEKDNLASLAGVKTAFATTKSAYAAAGVANRATLVVGDGGHRFYPETTWPLIQQMLHRWSE